MNRKCTVLLGILAFGIAAPVVAEHDIEYVQEHLPEAAMDNRFATLPVWNLGASSESAGYQWQAAYASTTAGDLSIEGPMLSISASRPLRSETRVGAFGFYDPLHLHSDHDARPLQTSFSPEAPIVRPVDAEFTHLDGTATDVGAGVFWARHRMEGWLGEHSWIAGVLWQRIDLQNYRFDYVITSGPQSGLQGRIDFDASYDHFTPFFGIELPRVRGDWLFTPHALFAYPMPRRGVEGHITGPGFDISGNTASAGHGKHFGDPSLTLGLTVTWLPAHLSIDAGTFFSQAYLEQKIHAGIESNWLLSFAWTP